MSNVNLKGDPKVLFGNRFPTIFIDKIEIITFARAQQLEVMDDAIDTYLGQSSLFRILTTMAEYEDVSLPAYAGGSQADFDSAITDHFESGETEMDVCRAHYSCYITFDKEKGQQEIYDILMSSPLGELYFYSIYNSYYGFNALIEKNILPLYDVFKANHTRTYLTAVDTNLSPALKGTEWEQASADWAGADSTMQEVASLALSPFIQRTQLATAISANIRDVPHNELEEWGFTIEDYRDSEGNLVVRIPFKNSFLMPGAEGVGGEGGDRSISLFATAAAAPSHLDWTTADGWDIIPWVALAMGYESDDTIDSTESGFLMPADRAAWRSSFNSYFGDITYQRIKHQGQIISPHEDIFVYAIDREPYADIPIQAFNGEYYAPSAGTTQKKLIEILTTLITQYEEFRDPELGDAQLNANVSRLELIIGRHGESTSILYAIQKYIQRYPEKSSIVLAGKFYGEVKKILFNFNKQVRQEKRVQKVLTLNPVVQDLRSAPMPAYVLPEDLSLTAECATFSSDDAGSEGLGYNYEVGTFLGTIHDGNYIPSAWNIISRNTKITIPWGGTVGDYMEYLAEEGIGGTETVDDRESGFGREDDFVSEPISDGTDSWKKGNTVVQNKGYWFFDYEKAVHALSRISSVFNVSSLEKYLNYKIPYEYFRMERAWMGRSELAFTVNNNTYWGGEARAEGSASPVTTGIATHISTTKDYPVSIDWKVYAHSLYPEYMMPVVYAIDADIDTASMTDTGGTAYGITDTLKHASDSWGSDISDGWAATAVIAGADYSIYVPSPDSAETLEHADKTYLKFINVDFPTPVEADRLSNYSGGAVSNGYRIAAFEYVDFMDDDIAFYNTVGLSAMNEFASADEDLQNHSRYYFKVTVEDTTTKAYVDIYNLCKNSYDGFMKYYEITGQIGSVDPQTDAYTRMFKEGIAELYPTPETQPWTRAAYVYEAMRQIMGSASAGTDTLGVQETIFQNAARWEQIIGPSAGSRFGAERFRYAFLVLLNHLFPQPELSQATGDPGGTYQATAESLGLIEPGQTFGENVAYDTMMNIAFPDLAAGTEDSSVGHDQGMLFTRLSSESTPLVLRGQKVITEPIYGNLLTSAMGQDDYVSSAATPAGAATLEPNEARVTVEISGGDWGYGTPKLSFFYISLLTAKNTSSSDGASIWLEGFADEEYDGPSFTKWLKWFNGNDYTTEAYARFYGRTRRRNGTSEGYTPILGYPSAPLQENVAEYFTGADWDYDRGGSDFGESSASAEVTQVMTVGDGVVINMDDWAASANAHEDDGYGSAEVLIAYEFLCAETSSMWATKRRGILRMDWSKFQVLVGGGRYIEHGLSDIRTSIDLTTEETGASSTEAGRAFLVAAEPSSYGFDPTYTYPATGGNHMVIYLNPWYRVSGGGEMIDGRPFQNDPGSYMAGNYAAIGPVLIERTTSTETRWGYDL